MKSIIQFKITESEGTYIAEGVDLAIVSEASTLDQLVKNIEEAVSLHFEGEDESTFEFSSKPSILLNYEIPQYA
jgi:predicted RNase H-like HicB family nuclease